MNLDELQSARDRERQTDKPQQLRESFYEDVGGFVEQLRAERERAVERHGSHYADEVRQLTDEIETACTLVEKLHERRIGKIVKAASLEAADLSPAVGGLTTEERELFETLVADIESHREGVLATVEGEDSQDETTPTGEQTSRAETTPTGEQTDREPTSAADLMGSSGTDGERNTVPEGERDPTGSVDRRTGASGATGAGGDGPGLDGIGSNGRDPETGTPGDSGTDATTPRANGSHPEAGARPEGRSDPPGSTGRTGGASARPESRSDGGRNDPGADIERERVLVTEDIDTFVGRDARDYDLAANDVVTLPATNADLLVEREAARRL